MAEENARSQAPVVAVVGGGQLARMMQESAIALGIDLRALVEATEGSTGRAVPHSRVGRADDLDAVRAIAAGADVLTFEHEHVPQSVLADLAERLPVRPGPSALLAAQDKLVMRERLTALGVPCPRWAPIRCLDDLRRFGDEVGWPLVVKTPVGGYDGHGVLTVASPAEAARWVESNGVLLAEERVPFVRELAVLLARRPSGEVRCWPVVETQQSGGVCARVTAPAPGLSPELARRAEEVAVRIATELDVTGVLAVEMFEVDGRGVLVNELAMRPHNSGHWTIDGAVTSQFEQHLRAVLDLPLGDTSLRAPACVMVNLLGCAFEDATAGLGAALASSPRARVHLYGKAVRPGRKLGHVTVCAEDDAVARREANAAVLALHGGAGAGR